MKLGTQWLDRIGKPDNLSGRITAVNEIAMGSRCKYRLDKETGQLALARALPRGVAFPTNFGFIPHTKSEADGEELDVMTIASEPLLPLTIIQVRIIGGFTETSSAKRAPEQRLIAVAADDPEIEHVRHLGDLDPAMRTTIETFVLHSKQNQGDRVTFDGWYDREQALEQLRRSLKR